MHILWIFPQPKEKCVDTEFIKAIFPTFTMKSLWMSSAILYEGNRLACSQVTCFKIKPKGKIIHFVLMLKSQEQLHWVTKYFGHAFAFWWCEIQRWISWANRLVFQVSPCSHPLKHGVTQSLTPVSLVASVTYLPWLCLSIGIIPDSDHFYNLRVILMSLPTTARMLKFPSCFGIQLPG